MPHPHHAATWKPVPGAPLPQQQRDALPSEGTEQLVFTKESVPVSSSTTGDLAADSPSVTSFLKQSVNFMREERPQLDSATSNAGE